jgi:hypothetical protein
MSDFTNVTCGTGIVLSWNVTVNGVVVGTYSWTAGTGATTHAISATYTYTSIAPSAGGFTIALVATSTICVGGGSWNWVAGGTATIQ